MLLVDDILFYPFTGLLWVFREIQKAAEQEMINEAEAITAELGELYMLLETGKITEAEFDEREKALLDRLEQLQSQPTETRDEREQEDASSEVE